MNLYILRHASAGTRRANPVIDVKRPLDKEGKEQCLLVANYMNALKLQFDLIVSSPLKRALQTASLVGTEVAYDAKIQVTEALSPTGSVAGFQQLVSRLSTYENVLVVGHNPNLPQFSRRSDLLLGARECAFAQGRRGARRLQHPSGSACLAGGPANAAPDLFERCEELAAENLAEVVRFFPQRPKLKLGSGAARPDRQQHALGIDTQHHFKDIACPILIQGDRQAQQHDRAMDVHVFFRSDQAHGTVRRVGPGFTQIARNRRYNRALLGSKSNQLRVGDDVLRVAMVALVVHELADIAHQCRRFQPGTVFLRQLMDRREVAEELSRVFAGRFPPALDRLHTVLQVASTPSRRSRSNC